MGQSLTQRPQFVHFVSSRGSAKAGETLVLKPLPKSPIALIFTTSLQERTQRPQRIHFAVFLSMKAFSSRVYFCGISPAKRSGLMSYLCATLKSRHLKYSRQPHSRHLCASFCASWAVSPSETSSKLFLLFSAGSTSATVLGCFSLSERSILSSSRLLI